MRNLSQSALNFIFAANPVEDVLKRRGVLLSVGELNAIVGQDRMDATGLYGDEIA